MRPGGWLYWVAVGLSGLTLALVVAYIVLVQDNRTVQTQVNEALIRALATATVNNKDDKLRDLLAQNGITINATGEAVPSAGAPAPVTTPPAPETSR